MSFAEDDQNDNYILPYSFLRNHTNQSIVWVVPWVLIAMVGLMAWLWRNDSSE